MTILLASSRDDQVVEVAADVAAYFIDRVAAELLQHSVRNDECDHRLGNNTRSGHGADVTALVDRLGRFAGRDVDGVECPGNRRDRLHGSSHPQRLARRHAALGATSAIRAPTYAVNRVLDLIVRE